MVRNSLISIKSSINEFERFPLVPASGRRSFSNSLNFLLSECCFILFGLNMSCLLPDVLCLYFKMQ